MIRILKIMLLMGKQSFHKKMIYLSICIVITKYTQFKMALILSNGFNSNVLQTYNKFIFPSLTMIFMFFVFRYIYNKCIEFYSSYIELQNSNTTLEYQIEHMRDTLFKQYHDINLEIDERIRNMRDTFDKQILITNEIIEKNYSELANVNIKTLNDSIRDNNFEITMKLIKLGCPHSSETIVLLLKYGNYELYKFWKHYGLNIGSHDWRDIYLSEIIKTSYLPLYHDIEWFNDVIKEQWKYIPSKDYERHHLIWSCLEHCDNELFGIVYERFVNGDSHHINNRNRITVYIRTNEQFVNICKNKYKLKILHDKLIQFMCPPIDDNKLAEKLLKKLIHSKIIFDVTQSVLVHLQKHPLWIHIDRTTSYNGCIQIIPKSANYPNL